MEGLEAEPEPEEVEEVGDEVTYVSLAVSWNWKVRATKQHAQRR